MKKCLATLQANQDSLHISKKLAILSRELLRPSSLELTSDLLHNPQVLILSRDNRDKTLMLARNTKYMITLTLLAEVVALYLQEVEVIIEAEVKIQQVTGEEVEVKTEAEVIGVTTREMRANQEAEATTIASEKNLTIKRGKDH